MLERPSEDTMHKLYQTVEVKLFDYSKSGLAKFFDRKLNAYPKEQCTKMKIMLLNKYVHENVSKFTPDYLEKYLKKISASLPIEALALHRKWAIKKYVDSISQQFHHDHLPYDVFLDMMDQLLPEDLRTLARNFPQVAEELGASNQNSNTKDEHFNQRKKQLASFWNKRLTLYFPDLAHRYKNEDNQTFAMYFELYDKKFSKASHPIKQLYAMIYENKLDMLIKELEAKNITTRDFTTSVSGMHYPLWLAIAHDRRDMIKYLLDSGIDPNICLSNNTPLHMAALFGRLELTELLLTCGADNNKYPEHANTPLHVAIHEKHLEIVNTLLAHGANPNTLVRDNAPTPLGLSIAMGCHEITKLLLSYKADPNKTDLSGLAPLHLAADTGSFNDVNELLTHGAEPNIPSKETRATPLHCAAQKGHLEIVNLLLANKAKPNAETTHWSTPLHSAVQYRHLDIVNELLVNHADPNVANVANKTPLYYAAEDGQVEMVKSLLANKADPTKGVRALRISLEKGHSLIAIMIAEAIVINTEITENPSNKKLFGLFSTGSTKEKKLFAKNELLKALATLKENPEARLSLSKECDAILRHNDSELESIYLQLTPFFTNKLDSQQQPKMSKN